MAPTVSDQLSVSDFKEQVIEAVEAQALRDPHTRIGFACKDLQLSSRIRAAPFPS